MSESNQTSVEYRLGLPESLRAQAATLYDEAVGQKLSGVIKDETVRLEMLADGFCPEFALVALQENQLVGLLGFRGNCRSLRWGGT